MEPRLRLSPKPISHIGKLCHGGCLHLTSKQQTFPVNFLPIISWYVQNGNFEGKTRRASTSVDKKKPPHIRYSEYQNHRHACYKCEHIGSWVFSQSVFVWRWASVEEKAAAAAAAAVGLKWFIALDRIKVLCSLVLLGKQTERKRERCWGTSGWITTRAVFFLNQCNILDPLLWLYLSVFPCLRDDGSLFLRRARILHNTRSHTGGLFVPSRARPPSSPSSPSSPLCLWFASLWALALLIKLLGRWMWGMGG